MGWLRHQRIGSSLPWLAGATAVGLVLAGTLAGPSPVRAASTDDGEAIVDLSAFGIVFGVILVVVVVGVVWLIVRTMGASLPIRNGVRSEGIIKAWRDTGMVESHGAGTLGSSIYDLQLEVTPVGGGAPVIAHTRAQLDSFMDPSIGARIPIIISPTNPRRVKVDHSRTAPALDKSWHTASDAGSFDPAAQAPAAGAAPGLDFAFDANLNPSTASLDDTMGRIASDTMPTINQSAAQILASGARGTAEITTCQPMGKTVRQVNPHATAHLDDAMWLFTVKVTVPGQGTWPAVMGHRVPPEKAGSIGPGVKLAVAVNLADKMNEVAIDWDKSPLP